MDFVTATTQRVFNPLVGAIGSGMSQSGQFFSGISHGSQLAKENERLKSQLLAQQIYGDQESLFFGRIEALQKLLALESFAGKTKVPARAIAYFPYEFRMTLSVGSNQGIQPGMPAVSGTGFLGVVSTVTSNQCQINLLGSTQLRLGAVIGGEQPQAGILRGFGFNQLELEIFDTTIPLKVGDPVLTSGYSEWIPAGVLIGRVAEIVTAVDYGTRKVKVVPSSRLAASQEVVILK